MQRISPYGKQFPKGTIVTNSAVCDLCQIDTTILDDKLGSINHQGTLALPIYLIQICSYDIWVIKFHTGSYGVSSSQSDRETYLNASTIALTL